MSENVRITGVDYAGDYKLDVTFQHSRCRTVDLRDPVERIKWLKPLRDRKVFARATVGEGGYSIAWGDERDMSASRVLEMALEQAGRKDTVQVMQWRWRNGLSLTDAGEALGVSRRAMAYLLTGDKPVPLYILLAIEALESRKRQTDEPRQKAFA